MTPLPPYHPERPFSALELEDIRQNWSEHPERFSYMAGRWLATLAAASVAADLRDELDPVTHEDPSYARGWNDALRRDPCEPGEAHRYRIECERCGQSGTLRVSVDPHAALAASQPVAEVRGGDDDPDQYVNYTRPPGLPHSIEVGDAAGSPHLPRAYNVRADEE